MINPMYAAKQSNSENNNNKSGNVSEVAGEGGDGADSPDRRADILAMQLMALTNDLNEREDQIMSLKKREQDLATRLSQKEKAFEQDTMVRNQLGKRLEVVLMDKEDLKDQLELLQVSSCFPVFLLFFLVINMSKIIKSKN